MVFFKDFLLTQEEACKKEREGCGIFFNSFLGYSAGFFPDDPAGYFGTVKYRETRNLGNC